MSTSNSFGRTHRRENHRSSSMKWIPKRNGCGRTRNIPDLYDGAIEITPIPTVEELNAHVWGEEFHACIIEQAEFESIWESRSSSGAFLKSEA